LDRTPQVRADDRYRARVAGGSACDADGELRQVCGNVERNDADGLADGLLEQGSVVPGRGRLVVVAGCVEPDDGVVVDDAAGLVFGDFDEPDADLGAQVFLRVAGQAGELAGQVDGEPAPQLRGEGVEQDVAGVVVAVRSRGLAEPRVIGLVTAGAGDVAAVRAAPLAGVAAGPAGQ
jgi:hypothetical protein